MKIEISKMKCNGCKTKLETQLNLIEQVDVKVCLEDQTIESNHTVSNNQLNQIIDVINRLDYTIIHHVYDFIISTMKCNGCVKKISKQLDTYEGIQYTINLDNKEVHLIDYNQQSIITKICNDLEAIDFKMSELKG